MVIVYLEPEDAVVADLVGDTRYWLIANIGDDSVSLIAVEFA